jgi:tetratricopeptide (TPR) repeat protein
MIGKSLGHYNVLQRIGAGGMGVVYLARDQRLQREVAVKVLPSGTVADEAARKRFRREALTLSRLNHPNVATIFDFNTTEDGTDYLVTEYIAGIGLDQKIAKAALPIREVISLGSQLAQGLSAAHAQSIVHRDLKPANVRINTDGRLKVLDFGLAMLVQPEADLARTMSLTSSQQITGSLPYMAPEQLRGESADARADVWAVGVVLYEMATGRRPFSQRNGPMLINSILNEPPEPPSKLNPKIPPGLEYIILKSLEKDPALRYQTSREVGADLDRLTTGESLVAIAPQRKSQFLLIASMVGVLLAAVVALYLFVHRTQRAGTAALNMRHSVAVLGFKNLSGRSDTAWVSTALAEMLTTELAAGEKLLTISGENVARAKSDLALPETDTLAPDTLIRVRRSLGSDYVVMGAYLDVGGSGGDQIRVDLRLQDAIAGQTIAVVSDKGNLNELDELATRAGAKLRSKLGVGDVAALEELAAHARRPANVQAARLYALGLEKLRTADALAARDLLLKAVEADPKHADSWAALASVWSTLGYDAKSTEAAKHAVQLASELPREERLRFEGQSYEAESQWDKAIASYRALFEFEPDNIDNGLKLANAEVFGGQASQAMQTLARLRQLPAPRNEDLRIDLAEARAAHFLSDFKREREIAVAAARKGEKQSARFLVARARMAECLALRNMGDAKGAVPVCKEAQRIFELAGDRYGVATTLNSLGNALYDLGDLEGARRTYEQVMQIDREIGNVGGLAGAMDNLASVAGDQGDKATAGKLARQALALYRETGDKMNISATLNNIASEMVVRGDLIGSRKIFDEALAIGREIHSDSSVATALVNLGEVRLELGDTDAAESAFQEAFSTFQKNNEKGKSAYPLVGLGELLATTGDLKGAKGSLERGLALSNEIGEKHESAIALSGIGRVLMLEGNLGEARRRFEEALALRKELDEKESIAASLLDLAELSLEEGQPAQAEQSLREISSAGGTPDLVAGFHALLGQALLAQGKTVDARKQAALAMASASKTQRQRTVVQTRIRAAAVQADSGGPSAAKSATRVLREIIHECEQMRFKQLGLQATLALGEIGLRGPDKNSSRRTLESLEKEARAAGFNLIAARAARQCCSTR